MADEGEAVLKNLQNTIDYLDKVFRQPSFVWNDGQCDLDLLFRDVAGYQTGRAQLLASTLQEAPNTQEPQFDKQTQPQRNEPAKTKPQDASLLFAPAPEAIPASSTVKPSKITGIATRSAVVPLVSDVWNASEPINYVRFHLSILCSIRH